MFNLEAGTACEMIGLVRQLREQSARIAQEGAMDST